MLTATPRAGPYEPAPEVDATTTSYLVNVVRPSEHTGEIESGEEDPGDIKRGISKYDDNEFVSTTPVGTHFLLLAPLPVPNLSSVDSHFHTFDLDAMKEERLTDIEGGGDDYDLDGCVELCVKNSIRRTAEYKILELDSAKYHCVCK
ncbi:hypothetical protein PIB30_001050 [Stylosanthes scabra]|uniref:Uncharacterized protein n=1 Tax=Stylosanthes scabra TaxID=79078 RepID=A0ABU6T2B1_9FABA|nr:hypothetical protein [Stylosanthes scabra]